MKIDQARFDQIANEIHSDNSPVGIDARKTHVLILHLLMEIDARLKRMEEKWPLDVPAARDRELPIPIRAKLP